MKGEAFAEFFRALHGKDRSPFPWQERLARLVCEKDEWPSVIDLPTGSGKTACIDIAIFHLLVCSAAGRPSAAARRIAFVVDRRIIVDEAANRAVHISKSIREATGGILVDAASLLEELSGQTKIDVFSLRGGVPREKNLVRDPTTVSVVLSTVDQLGSRLLFRGYGVSDSAKPMHAGMFGFDTLILLDEAHIAEPFRQTMSGVRREQARAAEQALGVRPLRFSQLSATPSARPDFSLDDDDRHHPVLKRRLDAKKPMRLLEVAKREELPKKFIELVNAELGAPALCPKEKSRIGIVVNRVSTARDIYSALARTLDGTAQVHLLVGRTRPIDRDDLMKDLVPGLKASTEVRPGELPIVVVATQTIEVGADFDFHAMFIEAASYPAIRQRVGRLNRLGLRDESRGAIVLVKSGSDDDPVYGSTIARTWELLLGAASGGSVDLGIEQAPPGVSGSAPESPATPRLTPSLVHLFAQTNPRPAIEPDVAQFLHGFVEQRPDVSVVWRDGVFQSDGTIDIAAVKWIFEALPPLAIEAMSLPLSSFRSWMKARTAKRPGKVADAGDLEGDTDRGDDESAGVDAELQVVMFNDEEPELVRVSDVRPGALVIVPCAWGGADRYGFAPESEPVKDLSLIARKDRRATIVFTKEIAEHWVTAGEGEDSARTLALEEPSRVLSRIENEELEGADARVAFFEWVEAFSGALREDVNSVVASLRGEKTTTVEPIFNEGGGLHGIVLRAQHPKADDLVDDSYGLQRTVEVGLDEHLRGVAKLAKGFAEKVGLRSELVEALELAGRFHDLGKADPRFQSMLGADGTRLLAKGKAVDRRVVLGARHECYSVALLDRHPSLLETTTNADLVRYLVGSHHGRGRGLQPIVDDVGTAFEVDVEGEKLSFRGRTNLASVDWGWAELFGGLQRRYGAWGLAYLETILRLADHRRSEKEVEEAKK